MQKTKEKKEHISTGCILIERDAVLLCTETHKDFHRIPLSTEVMRTLDVNDEKRFIEEIGAALDAQQDLKPTRFVVFFAYDTIFEKELPTVEKPNPQGYFIQNFLEAVPFDTVYFAIYTVQKKQWVVASNAEIYFFTKTAFEKKGHIVEGALSYAHIVRQMTKQQDDMTPQQVDTKVVFLLLKRMNQLRTQFMSLHMMYSDSSGEELSSPPTDAEQGKKGASPLVIYGIPFFVILIVILIVLVVRMLTENAVSSPEASLTPPPTVIVQESPSPALTEPVASPSARIEKADIRIQVLNGSRIAGEAGEVAAQLEDVEYTNIELGNTTAVNTGPTLIVFAESVRSVVRDEIRTQMEELFPNVSVREVTDSAFDVTITTGNSTSTTLEEPVEEE